MKPRPPQFFLRFFRWFCHPELKKYIEGDLMELYDERLERESKWKADLRFVSDVFWLFRPSIIRPAEGFDRINNYGMLKNYFKVGMRNILKYKVFSFINVFGLALAMSVCMLIILMIADQKRYDQFNVKNDRIYRILSDFQGSRQPYATSPFPLSTALKAEYPIVEEATHLHPGIGGDVTYQQRSEDMRGYFADPAFFRVFSFELTKGDMNTALTAPNSLVITSEFAYKLFNDENPLGKTVEFSDRGLPFPQRHDGVGSPPVSWGSFTVTGVIDASKYKSHLKFDALVSASSMPALYAEKKMIDQTNAWEFFWRTYTYVLLQPAKDESNLKDALNDLVERKYADIKNEETKGFKLSPQKLGDVQLGLVGNDTDNRLPLIGYYFLSVLAVVIMVSACLNYTNLSIARALTRAKEIGVRKVTGAYRSNLLAQFLSESILTSLLALAMALIITWFVKNAFMGLWVNQYLNFELPSSFSVYVVYVAFALSIGLIAGLYPAVHLSRYQPIKALKHIGSSRGKWGIRKALSVSQFVISLFFITTSILIFNQFKHYQTFDYGFNTKNIVNIELQGADYGKVLRAFETVPGVSTISGADVIPAAGRSNGMNIKRADSTAEFIMSYTLEADENFLSNLGIPVIAGRNFLPSGQGSANQILVNESAVIKLGYRFPQGIIGAVLETKHGDQPLVVVGVVKDFRYNMLLNVHNIPPVIIRNRPENFEYLNVKISSADASSTVAALETKWKTVDPLHPMKYVFFDDQLAGTHQGIFDVVSILGFVSFLAIIIACLGLLGMATYSAERRTKEVGIRKVMGAGELSIAFLLSREFLGILTISILIAGPLTYFISNLWLQILPNRVDFGVGTVSIAVAILLVLGLITIGSQTFRASKTNPVDSLKVE